jgi:hypothetical protein
MAECTTCGEYTKFNGGLCYSCYKENKVGGESVPKEKREEVGLDDKDWNYRYNTIKGRIAETLIQELFLSLNFSVFRYGMENTIPGIMDLLKGIKSEVANDIKHMPDFVIQDPRNSSVYFVEVKFRASETFKFSNLKKDYPYHNAYFVVVSKKHIKCLTYEELKEGKEITPTCKNYLGGRREFDLDKKIIIDFCTFAVQFFESV